MSLFDIPTGLIAFSLIVAAVVAVPISRVILARYRHRIDDLMHVGGAPPLEQQVERPGPRAELVLERDAAKPQSAATTKIAGAYGSYTRRPAYFWPRSPRC